MVYQNAISLHKTLNDPNFPSNFEHVTLIDQVICTGRQLGFQILRKNNGKIGINMTANKMYYINDLISLDMTFVHFKKLAKIQFLKYRNM